MMMKIVRLHFDMDPNDNQSEPVHVTGCTLIQILVVEKTEEGYEGTVIFDI